MLTGIRSNGELDIPKLKEYILYLLGELNRYKENWEITKDEYNLFNNELLKFKGVVNSSNLIPIDIKELIINIKFQGKTKTRTLKDFFRYLFLWDATAYRLNQLDDKEIIDNIESDIKNVLAKVLILE